MRRTLIVILAFAICVPLSAQQTAQPADPPIDANMLWKALLTGNQKFDSGKIEYNDLDGEQKKLENGQMPPITILSCSDSRVPPELIFNQSLGALFVVRTAGSVADELGLASIEYAILFGWTSLIVVLGHENCGAVHSSLNPDDPVTPSLLALAQRIRSSFYGLPYTPNDEAVVQKAVEANTRASAAWLTAQSSVVRKAVIAGKVKIVPAYYSLETGLVRELK
ncbi:MAG: carbonic anhydrase [Acidobacteriota bacterium]|nr:carbonic anhydrase [Acidobacteriota bacterium]